MQAKQPKGHVITVYFSQKSVTTQKVIDSSSFTVGRDLGCDVSIPDLTISRNHLKIYFQGDHIEVEDLGSANGSTYQGFQLPHGQRLRYENEEKIRIGLYDTHVWFNVDYPEKTELTEEEKERVKNDAAIEQHGVGEAPAMLLQEHQSEAPPPPPATKSNINVVRIKPADTDRPADFGIADYKTKEETNAKRLREVEAEIDDSIRQRDQIVIQANNDAKAILANAAQQSYDILARTRDTAALIRKTAEDESRIFRNKKIKELEVMAKSVEDRAAEVLKLAEMQKEEILRNADVVLQEATRDAQERLGQAKGLFAKVETEAKAEKTAILKKFQTEMEIHSAEKTLIEKTLKELKASQEEAAKKLADLAKDTEKEKFELQRLKGEHSQKLTALSEFESTIKKLKEDIAANEKLHAELLNQVSDLQRQHEITIKKAKERGEEILAGYDRSMNAKLAKESQIIEERRLALSRELQEDEDKMKLAFATRSRTITRNLAKFLQIYHLEHKTFDFKTLNDSESEQFEEFFHNNILQETKVASAPNAQMVGGRIQFSRQAKRYAFATLSVLTLILGVPQFLPKEARDKYSILDRLDTSTSADRMIASLKNDRDRRYNPEKVDFVFEKFSMNSIYGKDFAEKWLAESFQRKWSNKLQAYFYKKYRISEEIMIQVASKESTLVETFKKTAAEIHPDYFNVQYSKMEKDESSVFEEIRRLIPNEVAFRDYRQMVFKYYSENKD